MPNTNQITTDNHYMIVCNFNTDGPPIRHIVKLSDLDTSTLNFKNWYYERYNRLDGDEFIYCASKDDMLMKKEEIKNKYLTD